MAAIAREYGDVAYLRAGPTGLYLLSHPDLTSGVLVAHDDHFERIPPERRYSRWVVGDALFASEGELHARQRELIEPVMYGEVPRLHADTVVDFVNRATASWQPEQTFDVLDHHEQMTTALMVGVMFGGNGSGPTNEEITRALLDAIEASDRIPLAATPLAQRLPLPGKRRFRRALAELRRVSEEAARASEGSQEPVKDVQTLLRRSRDKDGNGMGPALARDESIALYRGQKRTASAALAWTWYLLSQHPDAEARFHEEIDSALGDRDATYDDLPGLPYTLMVLREAMRLYPPSWLIVRTVVSPRPGRHDRRVHHRQQLLRRVGVHELLGQRDRPGDRATGLPHHPSQGVHIVVIGVGGAEHHDGLARQRLVQDSRRHLCIEFACGVQLFVQRVLVVGERVDLILQLVLVVAQTGQHRVRQQARTERHPDGQREEHCRERNRVCA